MASETREYKNDVFCMLMERQEYALQVYNALNKSDYSDPSIVKITTIDNGVSLTVKNDASFVVNSDLNFFEHQSSVCPNIPLRFLQYYSTEMRSFVKNRDLYGKKLVKIQVPHFVVFYNGTEKQPEQYDLRLSGAFEVATDSPDIELICHVYNINRGNNTELMSGCDVLKGYMTFVDYVRSFNENPATELSDAVKRALDLCIEQDILADFFNERYDEVVKMVQLDFTFEHRLELQREEALNEGVDTGKELTIIERVIKKLQKGKDIPTIADELEDDESHIAAICSAIEKYAPDYDIDRIQKDLIDAKRTQPQS